MNDLILMHGALGSADDLQVLATELIKWGIKPYRFTFSGHGTNEFAPDFGIERFTTELQDFVKTNGLLKPHLFGYSMGGYVALNYAASTINATGKIITLGTKFNWNSASVEKEIAMLQPEFLERKAPEFLNVLKNKHGSKWKDLLNKTSALMKEIHQKQFLNPERTALIDQDVMLCRGDRDKMVTLDETLAVYNVLAKSQLYVLPGTAHALESVNVSTAAGIMAGFIKQ